MEPEPIPPEKKSAPQPTKTLERPETATDAPTVQQESPWLAAFDPLVTKFDGIEPKPQGDRRGSAVCAHIAGRALAAPVAKLRDLYAKTYSAARLTMPEKEARKAAKDAVGPLKCSLPAVTWSGTFAHRGNNHLLTHSGCICADLDHIYDLAELAAVRAKLEKSPHLCTVFISPTGTGLKPVFRVTADAALHPSAWLAVRKHVLALTGLEIDASRKDCAGLCFLSHDPEARWNHAAMELPPLVEAPKPKGAGCDGNEHDDTLGIETRRHIATGLLGEIRWESDARGFCTCPAQHLHETGNGERDCEIHLDGAPTIHCFHNSCAGLVDGANHTLRSRIGKAESEMGQSADDREESEADEADKPARKSAATRLVKFAEEFAFFHDPQSRAFVRLDVNGHSEIWAVNSTQFRNLLAQEFYKRTRNAINRNSLADAVATLQGRALFASPEEPVFLRVAPHNENILIDLCDPQWRVVEVAPDGWRLLERSPVGFIRTGSMLAMPAPTHGGSISPLWEILNVTPAQRPLVAGALLNYFHPDGPFFVTNLVGEQGTAKSCAARILRMLVDPNGTPLRSPPRTEQDLLVQAASNRCVALDNLSMLPPWLSDALCRLATGGGHSARSLYTDAEEFTLSVKRPVLLNGIEDVAARPDLAERALQIELETIPDNRRMSEKELWRKFEAVRPQIFSALLDGMVCALRELPKVKLDSLPRMADPALWATAGETAFGWKRGTFMAAYSANLNEGAIASVEAHPVGVAIRQLLDDSNEWTGGAAQLLKALNESISDELRHAKNWPPTPRVLSACLRRLAQALRRAGIEADFEKGKRRTIRLCKACNFASPASPASRRGSADDASDAKDASLQTLHDGSAELSPEEEL